MLNIGAMRWRFQIEKPTSKQNQYNENVGDWEPVSKVWGSIRTLSGRQLNLAQANTITSTATHQITIRYSDDIDLTRRLTLPESDGSKRVFRINHADDLDNDHSVYVLTVTEVIRG